MAIIDPPLAVVGGDEGVWGDKNNAALSVTIDEVNEHDARLDVAESAQSTTNGRLSALEVGAVTKPSGGTDGQALVKSGSALAWATVGSGGSSGLTLVDNGDGTFTIGGTGVVDNGNGTYTVTY